MLLSFAYDGEREQAGGGQYKASLIFLLFFFNCHPKPSSFFSRGTHRKMMAGVWTPLRCLSICVSEREVGRQKKKEQERERESERKRGKKKTRASTWPCTSVRGGNRK